jgi:hypothetical protein
VRSLRVSSQHVGGAAGRPDGIGYHGFVDETLSRAVALFNDGRYAEFQTAIEGVSSGTRAASERRFYTLLDKLAEGLLRLSDGSAEEAERLVADALRTLDPFRPRFRGLNVDAFREDLQRLVTEIRDGRAGRRAEIAPSRLPRLRALPE